MTEEKKVIELPMVFDTETDLMVSFVSHTEIPPITVAVPRGTRVVIQELGRKKEGA